VGEEGRGREEVGGHGEARVARAVVRVVLKVVVLRQLVRVRVVVQVVGGPRGRGSARVRVVMVVHGVGGMVQRLGLDKVGAELLQAAKDLRVAERRGAAAPAARCRCEGRSSNCCSCWSRRGRRRGD
jgi:hypothetical protein